MSSAEHRNEARNKNYLSSYFESKAYSVGLRKLKRKELMEKRRKILNETQKFGNILENINEKLLILFPELFDKTKLPSESLEILLNLILKHPLESEEMIWMMDSLKSMVSSNYTLPPQLQNSDLIEKLIKSLNYTQHKNNALWIMINLTYTFQTSAEKLGESGIPALCKIIQKEWESSYSNEALWVLCHIVPINKIYADKVISEGLFEFLKHRLISILRISNHKIENIVWLMSNILKTRTLINDPCCTSFGQVAEKILSIENPISLKHCVYGLTYMMRYKQNIINVIDLGILGRICDLLCRKEYDLVLASEHFIVVATSQDSESCRLLVKMGAIDVFFKLINCENPSVVREALHALANISGDSPEYCQIILEHRSFDIILNCSQNTSFETKINSLFIMRNIVVLIQNSKIFDLYLKMIPYVLFNLKVRESEILMISLETLRGIFCVVQLREAEGLDGFEQFIERFSNCAGVELIEGVMKHPNQEIYYQAKHFLYDVMESGKSYD
ncbi:hypothetical protein SteCoe_7465 [Stentor coeruleus]|uniref:Importin subunit alpha n=1 Tax=Stentor coeruleus TaxID=5963 RepID=A0A1R2CML6_9CILI|nr:hypothetical protein SteCoe_7465 [Stentor coeruleus]